MIRFEKSGLGTLPSIVKVFWALGVYFLETNNLFDSAVVGVAPVGVI